jgi:hypothetical protein
MVHSNRELSVIANICGRGESCGRICDTANLRHSELIIRDPDSLWHVWHLPPPPSLQKQKVSISNMGFTLPDGCRLIHFPVN